MEEELLVTQIPRELDGRRIDKACAVLFKGGLSRTKVKNLIEEGNLFVDGEEVKPSFRVRYGQSVRIFYYPEQPPEVVAQNIPIDIVYEDEHIIVVNKIEGMVVHPASGNPDGTLINGILFHCGKIKGGCSLRPGIVHRLDKDTSGLMVVTKNESAHVALSNLFAQRKVLKEYTAVVVGRPRMSGCISTSYGRSPYNRKKWTSRIETDRKAITRYKRLCWYEDYNLTVVKVKPITGRTHQIRVHFAESGWPIVGDPIYGGRKMSSRVKSLVEGIERMFLHSFRLSFTHPSTGEFLEFTKLPDGKFAELLSRLDENWKEKQFCSRII